MQGYYGMTTVTLKVNSLRSTTWRLTTVIFKVSSWRGYYRETITFKVGSWLVYHRETVTFKVYDRITTGDCHF